MTGTIALIAGRGALPAALRQAIAGPVLVCAPEGCVPDALTPDIIFRFEQLIPFLDRLADRGVDRIVLAGAVQRPRLDPALIDPATAQVLPRLLTAFQTGDDAGLRAVITVIEEAGLFVTGVNEVAPDLIPAAGILCGAPSDSDARDADRAAVIAAALGSADVGQGCVVAHGLCLAVETLPGTDAMLDFVARTRSGMGGVLWKAAKPGQDLRADLPTLGPGTVASASAAGLSGIAWQAGRVICLDRDSMIAAAGRAGLFLWAR